MKNIIQLHSTDSGDQELSLIGKRKLRVCTNQGIHILDKSDILYLKSDSNYCELFLSNGNKILCSRTLKYFVQKLNDCTFYRIHNSYLVNLQYVEFIDASCKFLQITNKENIPIARSRIMAFKKRMDHLFD